ncbi:unnamed protein product [Ascophyllum nodosum]
MNTSSYTEVTSSCFMTIKLTFDRASTRTRSSKVPKRGKDQITKRSKGQEESVVLPTSAAFESWILSSLKDMHGELGSVGQQVDVLSWDPMRGEGSLRISSRCIVPVRAALTLIGVCGDTPCAVSVTEASPFLAGLACERSL